MVPGDSSTFKESSEGPTPVSPAHPQLMSGHAHPQTMSGRPRLAHVPSSSLSSEDPMPVTPCPSTVDVWPCPSTNDVRQTTPGSSPFFFSFRRALPNTNGLHRIFWPKPILHRLRTWVKVPAGRISAYPQPWFIFIFISQQLPRVAFPPEHHFQGWPSHLSWVLRITEITVAPP